MPAEASSERPVLLLFRRPPYGTVYPAEGLRMAEALLAFQLPVRAVFMEDGVYNLLRGQGNARLEFGDLGAAFAGLTASGMKELIVLGEDLRARGLGPEDLVDAPIHGVSAAELRALMDEAKVVMPF